MGKLLNVPGRHAGKPGPSAREVQKNKKRLEKGRRGDRMRRTQKLRAYAAAMRAAGGRADRAQVIYERIIEGNDLTSIDYLARGMRAARSVCRISIGGLSGKARGYGTGFLIGPGLLMTNNHVLAEEGEAAESMAEFEYETDVDGRDREPVSFGFEHGRCFVTHKDLDFTIVGVAPLDIRGQRKLESYGWLPLDAAAGKAVEGDYLTIIQHPGGQRKQICVRENQLIKYMNDTVWYTTDTVGGSSGSPAFNNSWEVVALHHSGVPKKRGNVVLNVDDKPAEPWEDDSRIKWIANEGIRISSIVRHLKQRHADHPGLRSVIEGVQPPRTAESVNGIVHGSNGAGAAIVFGDEGATLVLPAQLAIRTGTVGLGLNGPSIAPDFVARGGLAVPRLPLGQRGADPSLRLEKVEIDVATYSKRKGFQATFLGGPAIPLPKLSRAQLKLVARRIDKKGLTGADAYTLHYWNYSVVMNAKRRLAFYAAVNVDGEFLLPYPGRDDNWLPDSRLRLEDQLLENWYGKPFDKGHLVRLADANWGNNEREAKLHGDDTFHCTNCSPQHEKFNRSSARGDWGEIENFVLERVRERRACVFNGPVFRDRDPELRSPQDAKKGKGENRRGIVRAPQSFWKLVVVRRANGRLGAVAFHLAQQQDLLATLPKSLLAEAVLTEKEILLLQVSVPKLEKLTGLTFGKTIRAADGINLVHEAASDAPSLPDGSVLITDFRQIRL